MLLLADYFFLIYQAKEVEKKKCFLLCKVSIN